MLTDKLQICISRKNMSMTICDAIFIHTQISIRVFIRQNYSCRLMKKSGFKQYLINKLFITFIYNLRCYLLRHNLSSHVFVRINECMGRNTNAYIRLKCIMSVAPSHCPRNILRCESNWMGNEVITPATIRNYRFRLISLDIGTALINT